jgi:anti-sigma B factor antagonist
MYFEPSGPGDDADLVLRTVFQDGTFVVALFGEMDAANAGELDRALLRAEGTDAVEIVLDLSGLHFIDSTGIAVLVAADARSRADGKRLSVLRGSEPVQRTIEICGLADRLPFAG